MEFYANPPKVMEEFEQYNGLSQDDILKIQVNGKHYTYKKC